MSLYDAAWWEEAALAKAAEIDRLTARVAELEAERAKWTEAAIKQQTIAKRLTTRLEAATVALRPFAKMADQVDEWQRGSEAEHEMSFAADDLRAAREALRQLEAPHDKA